MGKLQFLLRVPIEGGRSLHGFHCHSHRPRQCAVDRHLADICQVQSSRTSDLLRRPRRHPTCQRVIRQYCALALACFAAGGCATDPRLRPSLLVTNATCESGVCCPLYIRAFVWDFNIPQSPTGIEILDTCTEQVGASSSRRNGHSRYPAQTGASSRSGSQAVLAGVYLIVFDSAFAFGHPTQVQIDSSSQAIWPYNAAFPGSVAVSPTFVPGNSSGWTVTFPLTSQSGALEPVLTPSTEACSPT